MTKWEQYVKLTKSKKCKAGNCHNEMDDQKPCDELCVVCNSKVGMEYWTCFDCKKSFCEVHIKKHEEFNGRVFDND